MSIKMVHIYNLLTEYELEQLLEIGEGNIKPFPWSGKFFPIGNSGEFTMFLAPIADQKVDEAPQIDVTFAKMEKEGYYEVGFGVDGDDVQSFKSTASYYLKVLATVTMIVESFIKSNSPQELAIKGADKSDVNIPGQKNRIYFAYLEKHAERLGYHTAKSPATLHMRKNRV
jgi:hypothetical protein